MADSVTNFLTVVFVVVLAVVLLNEFGDATTAHIPAVAETTGDVLQEAGDALGRVFEPGYQR